MSQGMMGGMNTGMNAMNAGMMGGMNMMPNQTQ